jgi:hypothetical protein
MKESKVPVGIRTHTGEGQVVLSHHLKVSHIKGKVYRKPFIIKTVQ